MRPHEWCKVDGSAVFKASPGVSGGILWVSFGLVTNILFLTGCRRMSLEALGICKHVARPPSTEKGSLPMRQS